MKRSPSPQNVSICIPVYNGASHLDEAIWSARRQSSSPLEILIVDDCSGDDSVRIAETHAADDSRVRVVQNPSNLGMTGNWERCVEASRGDWVKYLFQDDTMAPNCLDRLCTGLRDSGARLGFVGRRVTVSNGPTEIVRIGSAIERRNLANFLSAPTFLAPDEVCYYALRYWSINIIGEPTTAMFRSDVLDDYGGFDSEFTQLCDWEFWLRVGVNEGLWFDPDVLATFRLHAGAASVRNQAAGLAARAAAETALLGCKIRFDPGFEALRSYADRAVPPVDIDRRVARHLYRLRLKLTSTPGGAPTITEHDLRDRYPGLPVVSRSRALVERALHDSPRWIRYLYGKQSDLRRAFAERHDHRS